MRNELSKFYVVCKALAFFIEFNRARCITILWQILRVFDYRLLGLEDKKKIEGRKRLFIILSLDEKINHEGLYIVKEIGPIVIHF